VLDTALIARRALTRDEAPNCKLATLARLFRTETEPSHRALADARATVGVLHGLIERVGNLGVHSVEELRAFSTAVPVEVRRKRHLADGLPDGPGVYVFRDARSRALYVGKSRRLRHRVRQYFTNAETRRRMREMVRLAERVDVVPCSTDLEAQVRELRLLDELRPPYNRRSKRQHDLIWLTLTREAFPRLSMVRSAPRDDRVYFGPFSNRATAELARTAVHEAVPLRQCGGRLPQRPSGTPCILLDLGRCGAPCSGAESKAEYVRHVDRVRDALASDLGHLINPLEEKLVGLVESQRYEDAASHRDRIAALVGGVSRVQRLEALTRLDELVGARREAGGWDLALIRRGRLAAAAHAPPGHDPWPHVHAIVATGETVARGTGPAPAASPEETECLLRWLERSGTRLVLSSGAWTSPARGAHRWHRWMAAPPSRSGSNDYPQGPPRSPPSC
jgi:DNA polymerase-3 subunit epsilon